MDESKLVRFTNAQQIVSQSGSIESNCNSITFINIGNDTVTVMGYPLLQGYQLYLPGSVGEIDKTNYVASFAGVGTKPALLVIRKIYA